MTRASALEHRLEFLNRVSNTRLQFLKRLYDGRPIWERYVEGDIEIHVHGVWSALSEFCLRYERLTVAGSVPRLGEGWREFPVFVFVRQTTEQLRPFASLVRLQPLNACDVLVADSAKVSFSSPSPEDIFVVFDRKLRLLLGLPGVDSGEFVDQVIQGGSQVVDDFPYNRREPLGRLEEGRGDDEDAIKTRIVLNDKTILVSLLEGVEARAKIIQVFPCPRDPFSTAIEGMAHSE